MIATTHPVSPEEVMALADGELSNAEAAAIAAHLAECSECASLASQFAATSSAFAKWTVPAAPPSLDASVAALIERAGGGKPPSKSAGLAFAGGRRLTVARLSAVAAVLVVVAAGLTMHHSLNGSNSAARAVAVRSQSAIGDSVAQPQSAPLPIQYASAAMRVESYAAVPPGLMAGNAAVTSSRARQAAGLRSASAASPGTSPATGFMAAPMIAHSVSLTVQVHDLGASRTALEALLARHRGYAAQLTVNTAEGSPRSLQSSLRVPDAELAAAISELRALGRVETETQSGEEVTQQHADLVARLQNSRETEQRLRAILEQRTGKIEDVLQVEDEIARVRGEIEQMEAEQKVLEHRVDFATIELQLSEQYREQLGPQSTSVTMQIRNAFVAGIRHGASTLLGILLFFEEAGPVALIWLAILGVPGFLLWRHYRRMSPRF